MGERYVDYFARQKNIRACIFRLSTVYARPSEGNESGFVTHYVESVKRGWPISLPLQGQPVRDLLHVDDFSRACKAFIESSHEYGLYNLGGGRANSGTLREIIDTVARLIECEPVIDTESTMPAPVPLNYVSDLTRIRDELGWVPEIGNRTRPAQFGLTVEQAASLFLLAKGGRGLDSGLVRRACGTSNPEFALQPTTGAQVRYLNGRIKACAELSIGVRSGSVKELKAENIKRVVVRGTNWVGDAVMTVPALRALRRLLPDAHLTLATRSFAKGIFANADFIDDLLICDRASGLLGNVLAQAREWRSRRFDLASLVSECI